MPYITLRDGAQFFYKDWGNKTAPAVVLSHGWPLNSDTWEGQMFFLASNGYRAIAHDRRGHGRSEQTWDHNDVDSWADDLAELIEKLDLRDILIAGHSTGGGEIVRYIRRHGASRVKKVVLISSIVPLLLQTDANPDGLPLSVLDSFRASMAKDRAQFFRDVPTGPFFGFNRPNAKISQGQIESWFQQGTQAGLKATYDTTYSWQVDYTEDLKGLDMPVHVIQGDDDQVVPVKAGALSAIRLLKHGTLKIYPGGPHALPNIHVDEINNDLLEILKS